MPPRPERVFWRPDCPDCTLRMRLVRREFQHRDGDATQMLLLRAGRHLTHDREKWIPVLRT